MSESTLWHAAFCCAPKGDASGAGVSGYGKSRLDEHFALVVVMRPPEKTR
jgi:hypothetical protein